MRYKPILVFVLVFLILYLGYQHYNSNYTNEGITNHVIQKEGYTLDLMTSSVPIELFIKPEWIANKSDEVKNLKLKLLEINHSNIILESVIHRENDIYFSFHTTFNMNYKSGSFLYNGIFNSDGTYSTSSSYEELMLFDPNKISIPFGQSGKGPDSDFSFGINLKDLNSIKEGFFINYSGFNLYNYTKI